MWILFSLELKFSLYIHWFVYQRPPSLKSFYITSDFERYKMYFLVKETVDNDSSKIFLQFWSKILFLDISRIFLGRNTSMGVCVFVKLKIFYKKYRGGKKLLKRGKNIVSNFHFNQMNGDFHLMTNTSIPQSY